VINLSIIIDNLISNSIKWRASLININFSYAKNDQLLIKISDNGDGLSKKFSKNPIKIFELGVNDKPPVGLSGSGIGLYYVKKLLLDMNADINFVGNNVLLKGACFEMVIRA